MIFALLLSVLTFAGDASSYQNLGFSPDGKYFAFAQMGIGDGSGFPYAEAGVIDVASNKFVAKKLVILESQGDEISGTPEQALQKAVQQLNLARFKILPGKNLGTDLLVRLPTDYSQSGSPIFSFDFWAEGGATMTVPKYEVLLNTKSAEDLTEGKWCTEFLGNAPQMFQLSIMGKEGTSGKTQILQDDASMPKSRGCVINYDVRRVSTFKGGIVVVVGYSRVGFEGPDLRSLVVTGKINFQN
jgi:predicted secreted protein